MNNKLVMLIEDDDAVRDAIVETLHNGGYTTVDYNNGMDALSALSKIKPALIISDVNMKYINGMDLMASVHKNDTTMPIILITAYGSVENAIDAIKSGAKDYLLKPFDPDILNSMVSKHIRKNKSAVQSFSMIANDQVMKDLVNMADRVCKSETTVLITGPSGTGKEVLSRYIHDNSNRSDQPYITINCAAIPENMLESILFGYEKGAYTGAHKSSPGKFELAQNGTILLDEISEMNVVLQAKILRVIQEKEVERLGSKKTITLNVRVIATSNRNLKKEVESGNFREDLYYRLNVFPLKIPKLSDRKGDIAELSKHLVDKWTAINNIDDVKLSESAINILIHHSWPGNIRELENVLQRAIILSDNKIIDVNDIYLDYEQDTKSEDKDNNVEKGVDIAGIKENEFMHIIEILESVDWHRKNACLKLGISERTLRYKLSKMKKYGYPIITNNVNI